MKSTVPAIILAAGESKRMGFPKALLRVGKKTLLEDQITRLAKAGCQPIVVVLGAEWRVIARSPPKADDEAISLKQLRKGDCHAASLLPPNNRRASAMTRISINHHWRHGQFSSIKCGLRALQKRRQAPFSRGCLILPVDCPFVPASVIRGIASPPAADRNDMPDAVIPIYQPTGKKGHPIWISSRLIKIALRADSKTGRMDKIITAAKNIRLIHVKSHAILNNVNTMKQWRSASGRPS